jgi:hypothetical protein
MIMHRWTFEVWAPDATENSLPVGHISRWAWNVQDAARAAKRDTRPDFIVVCVSQTA